ncbi:MAG: hypothetical protein ACEQSK_15680 [Sphingomonadaceae bacterium]
MKVAIKAAHVLTRETHGPLRLQPELVKRQHVATYKEIGIAYREVIGLHFPAMTAVQVARLVDDRARADIEATVIFSDPTRF